VDSGPVKADAIVVLGGWVTERPERAAELFKQGEAPKILVSGFGDGVSNEKLLEKEGVTNAAISLENKSRTTRENAEFSIPLLRQMGAHRVIIVTSWYHSRRALACFEHYAPDITFYSRPSYIGFVGKADGADSKAQRAERKAQWKRVRGYADSEYFKLLGYWVYYGVCPI
ncbi:MAG TPA: YdcF family protein, partial [Verrucomicrobiae bacterium]